ncbi:YbfB/YjiJ family MFS transporter [Diaphorobacter sp. NR2-3-3-1]|nr:YbfB/YjiJ family MFS transporter [Diaphorobacter caeni]
MKAIPLNPLDNATVDTSAVRPSGSMKPWPIAFAGMACLAIAMGIGRFAFTPLLPMMLHDGTLTLAQGSWLATANYLGYLAGALFGMALPWLAPRAYAVLHPAVLAKLGIAFTAIFTVAMALPVVSPTLWTALRFGAGVCSAITLLGIASWCMVRLAALGRPELAALIFAGPGLGILLTGVIASGMVALHWKATSGWLLFAVLALLLCIPIWPRIAGRAALPKPEGAAQAASQSTPSEPAAPIPARVLHALAYGLAGLGYIVSATFLPVIARTVLPGNSIWADLFWPIAGLGAVVGTVLSTRAKPQWDRRWLLIVAYLVQASGIALGLLLPTTFGFALGSVLLGLPFTVITFFGLQEARRLWPTSADSFVALVSVLYGLGQIAGPPLVSWLLHHTDSGKGFEHGLALAAMSLVMGAAMYAASMWLWPRHERSKVPNTPPPN